MKKIKYILIIVFLTSISLMKAQSTLEIEITGLKNNKGYVAIELFDKEQNAIKGIKGKIVNKKCIVTIKDLKNDKYAIQFFHDENLNEKIDKNLIGIPEEGFGFSNNGMGRFGPKKFKEWLFPVSGETKVTLATKYY